MITFLLFALGVALTIIGIIFGAFDSIGTKIQNASRTTLFLYGPGVVVPKAKRGRSHYYILGGAVICIVTALVRLFT